LEVTMRRREFLRRAGGVAGGAWLAATCAWSQSLDEVRRARAGQGVSDPRFWQLIRAQFQLPRETAYLNTAGLGSSPAAVTNMVKAMMDREEQAPAPGHSEEDWSRIRAKCAAFLGRGCSADEIAFVSTATEGINVILNGLGLARGDEVITSTHEHPALCIPLLQKIKTAGIEVKTFEPDLASGRGNVGRIESLLSKRTRVIFLSHVTCTTGQVLPVAEIARLASSRGVLVALDGAQSLCQFPIDIKATGADFYAASGHKFLLGPKRTGILYVRRDRIEALTPSIVGAYSDRSSSLAERQLELRPNAQRFEYGTQNDALIYGLEAAADFVDSIGLPEIWAHNQMLNDACFERLSAVPGLKVLSPAEPAFRSAMTTFRLEGRDNGQVANALMQRRLRVRSVTEGGLDAVRASFHVYNDANEVDRLASAVAEIAAGK
jgi:selenocysteine lyase/cysteine desulfurase